MRNAVYQINAIDENMILDFGLFHWNELMFNYIPAQIVGADFKKMFFFRWRTLINTLNICRRQAARIRVWRMHSARSGTSGRSSSSSSLWY